MTAARKLLMAPAAAGGAFNPQTDITWHSLFWAEGTDFIAQSYSDTDAITTWPNETSETDATATDGVTYAASVSALNSQPAVANDGGNTDLATTAFSVNPSYPISIVAVCTGPDAATQFLYDGIVSSKRNVIYRSGTAYATYAGGPTRSGGTLADEAHFFRATYDGSTGNETLFDKETSVVTAADAGSHTLTGLSIMHWYANTGNDWGGELALLGLYEGDITSDGAWADFKTWVTDHYGITLA